MNNGMSSIGFRVPPSPTEAKEKALRMKSDFAIMIDGTLKLDQSQVDQDPKAGDVFIEKTEDFGIERLTLKNGKVKCEGVETFKDEITFGIGEESPVNTYTLSSERGYYGEGGKKPVETYKVEEKGPFLVSSIEAGIKADGSGLLTFAASKADGTVIDGYQVAFPG